MRRANRSPRYRLWLILVVALCVPAPASAQPAADDSADLFVTLAARECPSYDAIRANLARNDIMESLGDLGKDTLYAAGEPINPVKELRGQPRCKPITGWRFTVGSGIEEKASKGPWGELSIVTGAEPTHIVTKESTPLRGWDGKPVSGVRIRGATTIGLNHAQAERAGGNALWFQGGTTTDPVLFSDPQFAGKYGFGALRCSIDDLNGDNVETVAFPTGTRHAFCYAYYVTPPPASGEIVIRKEVINSGAAAQTFQFGGNVSYNPGGAFELSAAEGDPAEQRFTRGETRSGEDPWVVDESVPTGWALIDIRCENAGASRVTANRKAGEVSIALAGADTVTCTYVNAPRPPKGALLLRKVTENGVGEFDFRILDDDGDLVARRSIRTKREGVAASASPVVLDPGAYRVFERAPDDRRGVWRLTDVSCNGSAREGNGAGVTIGERAGAVCTFVNRLAYEGRITIRKEAIGNTGTALFRISSPADPSLALYEIAKVKRERVAVRARSQAARADAARRLPFGRYVIQEAAAGGVTGGSWVLIQVICNGRTVPFEQGRAIVRISERSPQASCRFVNYFDRKPTPPPGPEPEPGEEAELVLSKELVSAGDGATPTEVFRITVANRSEVPARNVVVSDQPGPGLVIVSAEPSQGACMQTSEYVCLLGTIPAGGQATVLVTARNYSSGAAFNGAVVGSGTPDADDSNNVARATLAKVRRRRGACSSAAAVAHASC